MRKLSWGERFALFPIDLVQRHQLVVQRHQLAVQRHTYSEEMLTLAVRGQEVVGAARSTLWKVRLQLPIPVQRRVRVGGAYRRGGGALLVRTGTPVREYTDILD